MKIAKKAEQKNVVLNKGWYTINDINDLLKRKKIFYFNNGQITYAEVTGLMYEILDFRIFTSYLEELKVRLDGFGMYETVGISKGDIIFHISL